MDSIGSVLTSKLPQEPPQFRAIKDYIKKHHDEACRVSVHRDSYIVTVGSAPLATILRLEIPTMQQECQLDLSVRIHIGSV